MSYKLFLEPVNLGCVVTLSLVALSVKLQPLQSSVPPFLVKDDYQSLIVLLSQCSDEIFKTE